MLKKLMTPGSGKYFHVCHWP